jgi:hypothetical protein
LCCQINPNIFEDDNQFFPRYKPKTLKQKDVENGSISIRRKSKTLNGAMWYSVRYVDRSLLNWENLFFHSPGLSLWSDPYQRDDSNIRIESKTNLSEFFKLIRQFEKQCSDAVVLEYPRHVNTFTRGESSLIENEIYCQEKNKYLPGLKVKCKLKVPLFHKSDKMTVQQAIRKKILGRGSKVKLVLKYGGMVDDSEEYRSPPTQWWSVEQILLLRERPDWELEKYAFIEDSE